MSTPLAEDRATRREWMGLVVLALPTLLVSIDVFVMLLAVPHVGAALRASSTEQLWILDIYGFMVAGFLISMGTLGDRVGRKRLLLTGAAAFGAASILAAYSTSPEMLIAARAFLGIAGAAVAPTTLALVMNMFRNARQRASAVGILIGCFVIGAIIGPIVGGVMLEHFWWGSVFLLGVPAMLLLLTAGPTLLPDNRGEAAGRIDMTSVALSLATILPIVYGLKELFRAGTSTGPFAAIVVGLIAGFAFVRRQRGLADPMLDLRLFGNRAFSITLGAMLAYAMLSGGMMVFIAQHLQLVEGLSPLRTGLAMVPGMVAAIVGFQVAPLLARRIRPADLFAGGLVVVSAGLLLLTAAGNGSGIGLPMTGFVIACIGGSPLVALGTNFVVGSVPPEKAGSAAGVSQTGNELGYAMGVALLGSIGTAVYRNDIADAIPANAPASAVDTLTGATAAADTLPEETAAALLGAAHEAFASGMQTAAVLSAVVLTGVALVIAATLRRLPGIGSTVELTSADGPSAQPQQIEATAMSTSDA